jgi:hypothetical protein
MKKRMALACLCFLVVGAALAAARVVMVSGAGMGIDSDQQSADQTADSQAQNNLQNACPGNLNSSRKILDQCSPAGGNFVCNVNYTGMCQVN